MVNVLVVCILVHYHIPRSNIAIINVMSSTSHTVKTAHIMGGTLVVLPDVRHNVQCQSTFHKLYCIYNQMCGREATQHDKQTKGAAL